eukprot:CAMPEP_0195534602 /NCGR_PEP_ID=MMETSP0794_2-20130614/42708_1 /TAXON_ID=515487 /ORGANISM="Stephanopyxis turris, Strain CCMP 815" /LENGTH=88 /DNA_ID=CAMNT_0040667493 /DNA_START=57 /DNA_END=319 /DNA_ORIENTATION=-
MASLTSKPHAFSGAVLPPKHARELTPSLVLTLTSALADAAPKPSNNSATDNNPSSSTSSQQQQQSDLSILTVPSLGSNGNNPSHQQSS